YNTQEYTTGSHARFSIVNLSETLSKKVTKTSQNPSTTSLIALKDSDSPISLTQMLVTVTSIK
ncbi:hypothetical protein C0991_005652, partial [Blastosporella zonata]